MFVFDKEKRIFLKGGVPFFFKIDTAWMAFTNLDTEEFEEYVSCRKKQGFNALMIQNTPAFQDMPRTVKHFPFAVREDGSYDLSQVKAEYFSQVKEKLAILASYGLQLFIVPMWVSFIPHSQMEKVFDCAGKQFERFEDYQKAVDETIALYQPYHPVWLIGGDAELTGENETNRQYYGYMAEQIKRHCPQDLISAHTAGGTYIDSFYIQNGFVDFYTYQSGHMWDNQDHYMSHADMALQSFELSPRLPVMNLEPMYEAHGYGNRFGRFGAADIRRAFWFSVLGGAKAGFAYGAHGIWMFYDDSGFNNEYWSKVPLNWRAALQLKGAEDFIAGTELFEKEGLWKLEPRQELLLMPYREIRVAASPDRSLIAVYSTAATYVDLETDLSGYDAVWHLMGEPGEESADITITSGRELKRKNDDLSKGQLFPLQLSENLANAPVVSRVEMYQHNTDALLICRRK